MLDRNKYYRINSQFPHSSTIIISYVKIIQGFILGLNYNTYQSNQSMIYFTLLPINLLVLTIS